MESSVLYVKNNDEWISIPTIKGDTGPAGYTPVKGVDYWTSQDQQDIVNDVLAALPNSDNEEL